MVGVYVSVPVACFRKGLAREYLETEPIPPPATCYGFLLSLVGETQRSRHVRARVTATVLNNPPTSVVLRTVWRLKKPTLGAASNARPDFQQLLTGIELIVWVDSSGERTGPPTLEDRVRQALDVNARGGTDRFGGLSLGESTHLVNEVSLLGDDLREELQERSAKRGFKPRTYLLAERGLVGLPVWVDHVGSTNTIHVIGELKETDQLGPPPFDQMPQIRSPENEA